MFVVLSVLLVAVCLIPAAGKLTAQPKITAAAAHFGIPWERYRLIGFAEIAAAAGIIVGLTWNAVGIAAATGMALLLLGALVMHRRSGDDRRHAIPAFVALGVCAAYLASVIA